MFSYMWNMCDPTLLDPYPILWPLNHTCTFCNHENKKNYLFLFISIITTLSTTISCLDYCNSFSECLSVCVIPLQHSSLQKVLWITYLIVSLFLNPFIWLPIAVECWKFFTHLILSQSHILALHSLYENCELPYLSFQASVGYPFWEAFCGLAQVHLPLHLLCYIAMVYLSIFPVGCEFKMRDSFWLIFYFSQCLI